MAVMSESIFPPSFSARPSNAKQRKEPTASQSLKSQAENPDQLNKAVTPNLESIVRTAHDAENSDVHLGVGETPRFRARGEIVTTSLPKTTLAVFRGWLQEILSPQQIDVFFREKEFDGSLAFVHQDQPTGFLSWSSDDAAAHSSDDSDDGAAAVT